jgi:SAM-dependent methyltransferase
VRFSGTATIVPIAYYAQHAGREQWDSVWSYSRLEVLRAVASRDPLTRHLASRLGTSGPILDAGCGLGQYVVLLREQGYDVVGGDYSLEALHTHRDAYTESPLVGLDLGHLPLADGSLEAQISLGVVEHVAEGPHALLREAYRTMVPGGTLFLGVPWVNGLRRLVARRIQGTQATLRESGCHFYQYAYTRREVRGFLEGAGFRVEAYHLYSPAKGMRETALLRWALEKSRPRSRGGGPGAGAAKDRPLGTVSGLRRILYLPPVLWAFAHMILAVARKAAG